MVLPVNRTVLLTHLEIAERYVDKGAQHIDRLKEIIDVLARGGANTTAPKDLLRRSRRHRRGMSPIETGFFRN